MEKIRIRDEYIKLHQFLKLANIISQGSDAKILIANNDIKVNNKTVKERGKKLYNGDIVTIKEKDNFEIVGVSRCL